MSPTSSLQVQSPEPTQSLGERGLRLVVSKSQVKVPVVQPEASPTTPIMPSQHVASRRCFWPYALSFLAVVLIPMAAAYWYFSTVASDRYTSTFRVAVRSTVAPTMNTMGNMLGLAGGSGASSDAMALVQYLQSHAMVSEPLRGVDLAALYSSEDVDWLSRTAADPTSEELLKAWNRYAKITYESSNVTVVGEVTAFSPQDAHNISLALVDRSEQFINRLSEVARLDALAFARQEVEAAEERLSDARNAVAAMQDAEAMFNPARNIDEAQGLAAGLRERLAQMRAILATQQSQLAADAPSIRATQRTILGLEQELQSIESQTVGSASASDQGHSERPLSMLAREFAEANNTLDYAQRAYESALASFEAARIEADRKQIYLAPVVAPSVPQQASFPRPLEGTALFGGVGFAIWLLGLIGVFAVRDHM